MVQANVHEAKTQLSRLIEQAVAGEEVVIARNGKPAVRLVPVEAAHPPFSIGMFAGKMEHVPTWEEWQQSDAAVAELFGADCFPDQGYPLGRAPGVHEDR